MFACVADIGWITGHSYVIYGPLCNGGTTVLFESHPTYPNPGQSVLLPIYVHVGIYCTAVLHPIVRPRFLRWFALFFSVSEVTFDVKKQLLLS